jgi:hypothetical protein
MTSGELVRRQDLLDESKARVLRPYRDVFSAVKQRAGNASGVVSERVVDRRKSGQIFSTHSVRRTQDGTAAVVPLSAVLGRVQRRVVVKDGRLFAFERGVTRFRVVFFLDRV